MNHGWKYNREIKNGFAYALGTILKVSGRIIFVMDGFDTLATLDSLIGSGHIAELNAKLHSSKAYNIFQTGVGVVSTLTGGMTTTMKCFVAGTLVLTAKGLAAIESIKAGDMVYTAHEKTLEFGIKPVVETYIRETDTLIHITVNGEEIISTVDHPYYVKGKGFMSAGLLWIGAELMDNNGNTLIVEQIFRETLDNETVKVYNFKVEDYHTYFVGSCSVWVHNAECTKQQVVAENRKSGRQAQEERHNELLKTHPETQQEITIRPYDDNGKLVDYNVRVDEITDDFFNEVKASETAPYTKNQLKGYELLQRNGGEIRGAGKPGFEGGTKLGPTPGYTTRAGKTVPLSQDMAIHGGGK